MAQPPQRSRSQTRAASRRAQSTAHMASRTPPGGASEQFDFLAQVPSPALGGEQHQLQQRDAPSQTPPLRPGSGGASAPFAFLDQVPSPAMAGRQEQQSTAPSQTPALRSGSGGDSALFSFLDQIPSPVMTRPQQQTASVCSIPHSAAGYPLTDFLNQIPASQRVNTPHSDGPAHGKETMDVDVTVISSGPESEESTTPAEIFSMAQDVGPSAPTHPIPSVETPLAYPTRIHPQSSDTPTEPTIDYSSIPPELLEKMRDSREIVLEMLNRMEDVRRQLSTMAREINDQLVQIDFIIYNAMKKINV